MQPSRHQLSPLQEWICDECGEVISSVDDGWLEWYQERNRQRAWHLHNLIEKVEIKSSRAII